MANKTVLIIDDDEVSRMLSKKVLQGAGFLVEEAPTLASAFQMAANHVPHLIILDLMLPDGTGFDFLEKTRSSPELKAVPVIVLSGSKEKSQIYQAHAMGAKDYLHKPLDARILIQKTRKMLKDGAFLDHSFAQEELPIVQVRIPGRILFANEVGFMLELPVKIAPGSRIDVQSTLLDELALQDCVMQKTDKVSKSASVGQYINEITAIGLGQEAVQKIRDITRRWK